MACYTAVGPWQAKRAIVPLPDASKRKRLHKGRLNKSDEADNFGIERLLLKTGRKS